MTTTPDYYDRETGIDFDNLAQRCEFLVRKRADRELTEFEVGEARVLTFDGYNNVVKRRGGLVVCTPDAFEELEAEVRTLMARRLYVLADAKVPYRPTMALVKEIRKRARRLLTSDQHHSIPDSNVIMKMAVGYIEAHGTSAMSIDDIALDIKTSAQSETMESMIRILRGTNPVTHDLVRMARYVVIFSGDYEHGWCRKDSEGDAEFSIRINREMMESDSSKSLMPYNGEHLLQVDTYRDRLSGVTVIRRRGESDSDFAGRVSRSRREAYAGCKRSDRMLADPLEPLQWRPPSPTDTEDPVVGDAYFNTDDECVYHFNRTVPHESPRWLKLPRNTEGYHRLFGDGQVGYTKEQVRIAQANSISIMFNGKKITGRVPGEKMSVRGEAPAKATVDGIETDRAMVKGVEGVEDGIYRFIARDDEVPEHTCNLPVEGVGLARGPDGCEACAAEEREQLALDAVFPWDGDPDYLTIGRATLNRLRKSDPDLDGLTPRELKGAAEFGHRECIALHGRDGLRTDRGRKYAASRTSERIVQMASQRMHGFWHLANTVADLRSVSRIINREATVRRAVVIACAATRNRAHVGNASTLAQMVNQSFEDGFTLEWTSPNREGIEVDALSGHMLVLVNRGPKGTLVGCYRRHCESDESFAQRISEECWLHTPRIANKQGGATVRSRNVDPETVRVKISGQELIMPKGVIDDIEKLIPGGIDSLENCKRLDEKPEMAPTVRNYEANPFGEVLGGEIREIKVTVPIPNPNPRPDGHAVGAHLDGEARELYLADPDAWELCACNEYREANPSAPLGCDNCTPLEIGGGLSHGEPGFQFVPGLIHKATWRAIDEACKKCPACDDKGYVPGLFNEVVPCPRCSNR